MPQGRPGAVWQGAARSTTLALLVGLAAVPSRATNGELPSCTFEGRPGAVWQGAARSTALALLVGLAALLSRAAGDEFPSCTFEACPVCLPDAKTSLSNLSICGPDNRYHQVPLRVAKCPAFWDAQTILAQIAGFLLEEQLGVAVDYVPVRDSTSSWLAVNSCIGYNSHNCYTWEARGDEALKEKVFPDVLADVMFASFDSIAANVQTTEGTDLVYESKPGIILGNTGFTILEGLFVPLAIVERAAADGVELRWFLSMEADKARSYFDVPQRLIDDGIVAERQGCSSNLTMVQNSMDALSAMGYQCRDSWWITPTCASKFGDKWATKCMVMIEDDWSSWKGEVYAALARTKIPIAKLIVGYDMWLELSRTGRYNATTNWWSPDATLANTAPEYMRMPLDMEPQPSVQVKAVYAPMLEADPKVKTFLTAFMTEGPVVADLMKAITAARVRGQGQGDGVYRKVACDWLRDRRDVWSAWMPSPRSCVRGQVFDANSQRCMSCIRGTYAPAHSDMCASCPAGTFTQVEGALECSACIPGQFSSVTGASTGEVCQRCPQGTFAALPGRSACEACNGTFTTLFPGAILQSDCTCAVGSYLRLPAHGNEEEAFCADCVKGLQCPGGAQRPLQAAGFAAAGFMYGGPTTVVACASDVTCPGGTPLGSCPDHHEGVACDVCVEGYFMESGRCSPCHRRNLGMTIGPVVFLVVVGGGLLLRAVWHRVSVGASSAIGLMLTCSLAISTVQMVSSFQMLLRKWPEPLASLFGLLRFFSIDLNVIGLACVVKLRRPELAYLGSLLLHPAFAAALVLCVWILRLLGWSIPADEVVNMQGVVVSTVYIVLTLVSLRPWQCNANPDGTSSVASSRAIICWSSPQHGLMIGMSVVALCVYVVGAFAIVVWATWVYPSKLTTSRGEAFIRRFRFLYFRFNAENYWFVIPFMLRSVLVSVLPVVLVNQPPMCVKFLVLVVGAGCVVQCSNFPWREQWVNYLDAMASLSVLLLLDGGLPVTDHDPVHMEQVMYFYLALIFGLGACLLGVALFCLWRWLFPPVQFGALLCHHKAGAAVLARWFKMLLTEFTSDRVFLDSDELDRLDKLFGIVAREIKYLVIILTEHTMERIWCAGEMATAVRYKVDIVVVACNDYTSPTDDFIGSLASIWTEEQQNQVFALGVCIRDIQEGYRAIRDLPALKLDREQSQASEELVIHRVFEQCTKLRATSAGQMHRLRCNLLKAEQGSEQDVTKGQWRIVVAGDMEDAEAATACAVIARLLAREMAVVVVVLERGEASLARHTGTRYLFASLSRNVLRNAAFAATLVDAEKQSLECAPIIADTQFYVPGAAFWQERPGKSTSEWPELGLLHRYKTSMDAVLNAYRRLFNIVATRFSTYGSARMQATEVKELVHRFHRGGGAKMTPTASPPTQRTSALPLEPEPAAPDDEPVFGVEDEDEEEGNGDVILNTVCNHFFN